MPKCKIKYMNKRAEWSKNMRLYHCSVHNSTWYALKKPDICWEISHKRKMQKEVSRLRRMRRILWGE